VGVHQGVVSLAELPERRLEPDTGNSAGEVFARRGMTFIYAQDAEPQGQQTATATAASVPQLQFPVAVPARQLL
jgi:hypothetical protein